MLGCCLAWGAGIGFGQAVSDDAFVQDPLPDGVVSVEVEHFHASVMGTSSQAWVRVDASDLSGRSGMQALPNDGIRHNTGYETASPRLDYRVLFDRAGVHYLVARGRADSSDDDSFHAGLNGVPVSTADRIRGFNSSRPTWSGTTSDLNAQGTAFEAAWVMVPAPGEHTVNLWMREDGLVLDTFILTTNPAFMPSGEGPVESSQGGGPGAEAKPDWPSIRSLAVGAFGAEGEFDPVPASAAYRVLQAVSPGSVWETVGSASIGGFGFSASAAGSTAVYAVEADPLSADVQRGVLALNRLAYGPTPDELDRVLLMGADAYVYEQLHPETLSDRADTNPGVVALASVLEGRTATLDDLRAWYGLRAILSDRQWLEVTSQFINNHFVTYYYDLRSWFRDGGIDSGPADRLAVGLEYEELRAWRDVLMDPHGTFYDLLRISAESPAMIIYLDTVKNDREEPNENYARELLELFTMGVDNGYDQEDIEEMARVWTGWRVRPVRFEDVGDPFVEAYTNETAYLSREATGWLYRKGSSEPDAGWMDPGYTPGAEWLTGQASIGYGDDDDRTELTDMRGNYRSVYLRKPFTVSAADAVERLRVAVYIDDGCVVWLNGREVVRVSVPDGPLAHDGSAYGHEAAWEEIVLKVTPGMLNEGGDNVLAIQALNASLNSSDFSVDAEISVPAAWQFAFDAGAHDPSNKVVFAGRRVDARFGAPWAGRPYELALPDRAGDAGIDDGYDVVEHLANLPYTMEYMSVKLCRWFVHEDFYVGSYYNVAAVSPEAQLIRDCMTAWDTPAGDGRKGNLRAVMGVIFASDLFQGQAALQQKVKTPFEYAVSAIRALRVETAGGSATADSDGYDLVQPMGRMGMNLFTRSAPDGYPEEGHEWIDTGTVTERLRFIQNLMMAPDDSLKAVDYGSSRIHNVCDPVRLIRDRLPPASWNDPEAVVDCLLGLVYPAEGTGNLALDRAECLALLNADAGGGGDSSPFSALTDPAAYDRRVRGLAGLILANPKFHEQ